MPEIRSRILANKNWREIAEVQKVSYFSESKEDQAKDLEKLMGLYNADMLEDFCEAP